METQRRQQQAEKKEDRRLLQFAVLFPNVLLHSRTKHEKHDVLLKTHTDMVAFCKYTTSPFFFFVFFCFPPPLFSCRERRLLCNAASAWSRPLSHSAVASPAVFTLYFVFFFPASEDRRGYNLAIVLYFSPLPPTTILPCLTFAQMTLSADYSGPALHHPNVVVRVDPRCNLAPFCPLFLFFLRQTLLVWSILPPPTPTLANRPAPNLHIF